MGHYQELPKLVHPDFAVPNRKPVGAVEIDWTNPITRGLIAFWYFDGVKMRDLLSGQIADNTNSTPVALIDDKGLAYGDKSSVSSFWSDYDDYRLKTANGLTVASSFWHNGVNRGGFSVSNSQANGVGYNWGLFHSTSAYFTWFIKVGGVAKSFNMIAGNGAVPARVIFTGYHDGTTSGAEMVSYKDSGVIDSASGTVAASGTLDTTDLQTSFSRWNSSSPHAETHHIMPIWGRALSATERESVRANIYQLLKPLNPITYFIPSAGGGAVAQQIDLQWGVRQLINQSANLHWGVLNTVSQSSSLQWALLNTVSNNTDLRWGLLSLVNQTSDLRWDILAALGVVGQSVDIQWSMLQKAAQNTDLRWRILSLVFNDTDLRWGLINNVSQQADLRYALLANAAQTIDLQWDTLSSLASVSNSVDLRWDILAYVSQSLDAQWSTLELVSTETDLQWQIAVLVSKDADLQWALKQSAGQAVDIRWDVIAKTSQSIDLRWSIISDNQFADITGVITLRSNTPIITLH